MNSLAKFNIPGWVFPIIILLLWLLNPLAGILSSLIFYLFATKERSHLLFIVMTICGLIISFQMNLPLPTDLTNTKAIYEYIHKFDMSWTWSWLKRDPLSYGLLTILSHLLPDFPISFYFLNFIILSTSQWVIVKNMVQSEDRFLLSGLVLLVYLGCLDLTNSHHYMRQTTAFFIFFAGLLLNGRKSYFLIIAAILWHGSAIFLVPVLIVKRFEQNKFKVLSTLVILSLVSWPLGLINIYQELAVDSYAGRQFIDFSVMDRFLTYFFHPRHAEYFKASLEVVNFDLFTALFCSLIITVYSYRSKNKIEIFSWSLLTLTIPIIFFRHHVMIFSRLLYAFEIIFFLCLIAILLQTKLAHKKIFPAFCLLVCLMKIHYFVWPFHTQVNGRYLWGITGYESIKKFPSWEMNKEPKKD